jgi:hypothetical protein
MKMDADESDQIIAHLIKENFLNEERLLVVLPEGNTALSTGVLSGLQMN